MIMPTFCPRVQSRVSIVAKDLIPEALIPPLIWSSVAPAKGEKHKIEAHLSVRHALKVHEGRYQCNRRRGSYILHVRDPKGVGAGAGEPTESGYQTIDELTPNSADDFFTRAWLEQQQQQQQLPHQSHKLHKSHLGYGNASLSGSQPWHPSAGGGGIHRVYSATPPDFPPPRLNLLEQTVAPPEPPTILYNPNPTHPTASATATETSVLLTTAHHHAHHQQQLQQQSQHTLNAFQLPLPPRPNPGQNERYQTYAPHYVPPVVVSGAGAGAGADPGAGASGEQTTISAATSTRAMMGGGGGVAGAGFSAGASGPMLGAGGHMLMGGQGHQVHLQHQTLLPVKMGEPHAYTNHTHVTHSHTHTHKASNSTCICPLCCCCCSFLAFNSLAPIETAIVFVIVSKLQL